MVTSLVMTRMGRRVVITAAVLVLGVLAVVPIAGLLAAFPTSLLIPLLLMAVATALFYVWA
jgi:ABC-type anion transport system duplicated permease subunit